MSLKQVQLSGSYLTPEQCSVVSSRMQRGGNTYFRKMVDFELWDAIQHAFESYPNMRPMLDNLRAAALDTKVSKSFKNAEVTMDNIEHYGGITTKPLVWNRNFRLASALLEDWIKIRNLTPVRYETVDEVISHLPNKNASAGAIADGTKIDNAELILEGYKALRTSIANGETPWIPALSFHRSQIGHYLDGDGNFDSSEIKYKDRLVWGLDAATVAVESQYAIPLVNWFSQNVQFYAGGKTPDEIRNLVNNSRMRSTFWYSLDFSQFDQTIPAWLIKHVFYLLRKFYSGDVCHRELKWIENNFINTAIVKFDGTVVVKDHGIPSGSNFTQLVGSMANALVILTYLFSKADGKSDAVKTRYVRSDLHVTTNNCGMLTMGDDNLFFSRNGIDVAEMSSYVKRNFGMTIHPDKTVSGGRQQRPTFLKREWSVDGEYRDLLDVFINVIHPERERSYKDYSPYHILYGLYLTYRLGFPKSMERQLVTLMENNGGIERLRDLKGRGMPGVFRQFGDKAGEALLNRAKAYR